MKKIISICLALAVASWLVGPAFVGAVTGGPLTTGLQRGEGGGEAPIVKAKWEMDAPYASLLGTDDSIIAGAQFDAPGTWNGKMNYSVCAIVTDPNGAADIYGVYADIYYPALKAIHAADPANDRTDQATGVGGCGAFIEENTLLKLTKTQGYNLFCGTIHDSNNNLPFFNETYYSNIPTREARYSEICAVDGELMKEEAFVYCDDKSLIWEDPAGLYTVKVSALDKSGNRSAELVNNFEYLPLTKFAADFTNVSYGEVLLNTHKKISGDINFGTATNPTVQNLGNTRLQMRVAQDDMGLGQSSGLWNVQYDARVGNYESDWSIYSPFKAKLTAGDPTSVQYKTLHEILDLSETEEMDFSVLITKWPDDGTSYGGYMWLGAQSVSFRTCVN